MPTSSSRCSPDTRRSKGSRDRQAGAVGADAIERTGWSKARDSGAGKHRSELDVLSKVEKVLAQLELGTLRRPGGHFREVSLGQGRLLAVDVFQSGPERGHVRVHLHGTMLRPTSPPPVAPSGTMASCSACQHLPDGPFPGSYTGPRGAREYFGFQWHTDSVDLGAIEAAARWLADG